MYEWVSEVLLHLGRMSGIVFTAQTAKIWPKTKKKRIFTIVLGDMQASRYINLQSLLIGSVRIV